MARVKNFCGFELKTGGLIIGFVSFFANLLYFVTIVEAALLFVLPTSEEKKNLFGPNINALERDSIAFPIVLVAAVAALYGVISSYLLIVGVKDVSMLRCIALELIRKKKVQLNDLEKLIKSRRIVIGFFGSPPS